MSTNETDSPSTAPAGPADAPASVGPRAEASGERAGRVVGRNVSKTFGNDVRALEDISFDVEPGEFLSIVGPSGCGKSTLLRLIAGLLPRDGGELTVNADPVSGPRQDVALMFQKPNLLPWKTSFENVLLPATLKGDADRAVNDEAMRMLEMVGLDEFIHAYPTQLSGGMQQRVAVARSLMIGAGILLLDEPFGAVDELTREKLNLELLRIKEALGLTVVLITHNISEAIFLADRVLVMTPRPGRIADAIDVDLPHPRTIKMTAESRFAELELRARRTLADFEEVNE